MQLSHGFHGIIMFMRLVITVDRILLLVLPGRCCRGTAVAEGRGIDLSKKKRDLLWYFTNTGCVLPPERVLQTVWGSNSDPRTNVVDDYVGRSLRKTGVEGGRIANIVFE